MAEMNGEPLGAISLDELYRGLMTNRDKIAFSTDSGVFALDRLVPDMYGDTLLVVLKRPTKNN